MANKRGQTVDTTFLSLQYVERRGILHRDYLAHCFRWTHVIKRLYANNLYRTANLLDVGCGTELNLATAMYASRLTHTTGSYTGVDAGPIKAEAPASDKFKAHLYERTDFLKWKPDMDEYDVVVSFEVMEHVEACHAFKMLKKMQSLLPKDGYAYISTPCYDQRAGAADNHVNEMSYEFFRWLLRAAGFEIAEVYGTFASQKDYKPLLAKEGLSDVFNRLSEYYDSNILSCIMAPMFPEQSRNCLWVLKFSEHDARPLASEGRKFLANPETHSSSQDFPAQLQKILKEI